MGLPILSIIKNFRLREIIVGVIVLVILMNITPTGLVPNEDTGTIMITADLQPGTS